MNVDSGKLVRFLNAGLPWDTTAAALGITLARLKQEMERPEIKERLQTGKMATLEKEVVADESLEQTEMALIAAIRRNAANPAESLSTRAAALKTIVAIRESRERRKPESNQSPGGKSGAIGLRLLVSTQIAAQLQISKTSDNEIYEIGDMQLHPMALTDVQRLLDNEQPPRDGFRQIETSSEEDRSSEETEQ